MNPFKVSLGLMYHFLPLPLFSATQSAGYGLSPVGFISSHIMFSHLFLGLPLLLLPDMVPVRAAFGNLPFYILLTCLYHLR